MSETTTPEIVRVPGLDGLVTAFRNYAAAAAAGTTPDGTEPAAPVCDYQGPPAPHPFEPAAAADQRTADERVAEAYAHAAACLETHLARLAEQSADRLNGPDLRARLALVEAELARTREWAAMAEHKVADVMRAAHGIAADVEVPAGDLTVTGVIAERQRWRDDYDGACKLVAAMHAAAMGGVVRGPLRGVVEDVWALRVALEALRQTAETFLTKGPEAGPNELASMRGRLGDAALDAALVLHPVDAEEHAEPIDVVNAIRDVIECRSVLARIAAELDELPRRPAGERKARRETLRDLARQYAGAPPYANVETRVEILLALLHDGWGVIANAGLHRGNWDHEHPEWVTAAERWRDRFHQVTGVTDLELQALTGAGLPDPTPFSNPPEPVNTCQADADAARHWAGEVWRLQSGMTELGIAVEGTVHTGAVDTALTILRAVIAAPAPPAPATAAAPAGDPAVLPELAAYADMLDAVPNEALTRDMARIATMFRGLGYDPDDRPTEVLAVRRAAHAAGMVPFPDPGAPIRGYRGGVPPMPKVAAAVVTNTTGGPVTLTTPRHQQVTLAPGDTLTVTAATGTTS